MGELTGGESGGEELPLSQDTFTYLWTDCLPNEYIIVAGSQLEPSPVELVNENENGAPLQLNPTSGVMACTSGQDFTVIQNTMPSTSAEVEEKSESRNFIPDTTISRCAPSSLPACNNWPGRYNFNISFGPQEKNTKGVSWTYSDIKDKLYVSKGAPCPINFSTNYTMPQNTTLRTMAIFSQSEHASEIVQRCVNHSLPDVTSGHPAPEHLIRCECLQAAYDVDQLTGRHSVVVPYENPQVGDSYSTYIFKFVCWGSCAGGLNRRPITVIFTLERNGEVVGRRALEVRICACPGRDRRTDEKQVAQSSQTNEPSCPSSKRENDESNLSSVFHFTKDITIPPFKKPKLGPDSKDGTYVITVHDYSCFQFLEQMKKFYEMCSLMRIMAPDIKRALQRSAFQGTNDDKKSSEESE